MRETHASNWLVLPVMMICLVLVSVACGTASSVNVEVYDADNAPPETLYCKFVIAEVEGEGTHDVDDILCVVCGYDQCPGDREIIPAEGVKYKVEIEGLTSCQTCQGVDLVNFYKDI